MAYIGAEPSNNFVSLKRQVITGNGGTSYTLDHTVASVNDVAIFVNNVRQDPATYSISGTALTLGGTISSSDSCYVIFLGQALQTVTPDADTITTAMLKSNAVTTAKITDANITSAKMFSGFANGITMADQWRLTTTLSQSSLTTNYITANWERVDTDAYGKIGTGMSESSGEFSFPSTGLYSIDFRANFFITGSSSKYNGIKILVTTNNSTYNVASEDYDDNESQYAQGNTASNIFVNVTDTSNIKVKFQFRTGASNADLEGNTGANRTYVSFVRLGDSV